MSVVHICNSCHSAKATNHRYSEKTKTWRWYCPSCSDHRDALENVSKEYYIDAATMIDKEFWKKYEVVFEFEV